MIYYIEDQEEYGEVCVFTNIALYNPKYNVSIIYLTNKQLSSKEEIKNKYGSFWFIKYSELETFLTGVDL